MDKKNRWNTLIDNNVNLKKYIRIKINKNIVKEDNKNKLLEDNCNKDDSYYKKNIEKQMMTLLWWFNEVGQVNLATGMH